MHRFVILLFYLIIINANAQNERYLQWVDLKAKENSPFFSRTYSLPELAVEAIRSGKIQAYDIDYSKNTIDTLDAEEIRSRLIMSIAENGFDFADTIYLIGNDFSTLEVDISKRNNATHKINYIHFKANEVNDPSRHNFSVSFVELSDYLNQKKALWIRNSNPWLWKGQVIHSNGNFASKIIYNELPNADNHHIHLFKGQEESYEKIQIYGMDHKLVHERPFPGSSGEAEIKFMTSALLEGDYMADKEKKLKTDIQEVSTVVQPLALDENFFIIQHEDIHLLHPENAKFFMEEKELPTLLMEAIDKGKITKIYKDDLLTEPMTMEEYEHNASEEMINASDEGETHEDNLSYERAMYTGRSVTIVSVSWKKYFNTKGEVIAQMPYSIGLFVGPEQTLTGLSKLLGYFSFNDVFHTLKNMPEAYYNTPEPGNFINDLMKRDYFSYFISTSGISVQSR